MIKPSAQPMERPVPLREILRNSEATNFQTETYRNPKIRGSDPATLFVQLTSGLGQHHVRLQGGRLSLVELSPEGKLSYRQPTPAQARALAEAVAHQITSIAEQTPQARNVLTALLRGANRLSGRPVAEALTRPELTTPEQLLESSVLYGPLRSKGPFWAAQLLTPNGLVSVSHGNDEFLISKSIDSPAGSVTGNRQLTPRESTIVAQRMAEANAARQQPMNRAAAEAPPSATTTRQGTADQFEAAAPAEKQAQLPYSDAEYRAMSFWLGVKVDPKLARRAQQDGH